MGRDKALIELNGRTLASLAVEMLQSAGISAAIAGARSKLDELAPVIADETPDEGPLRGICSALATTQAMLAGFISVDLPLMPASLLRYLVRHALMTGCAVTLASVNGFPQTFPAVIRTELLPHLHRELGAGRRGCFAAFETGAERLGQHLSAIPVELLVQAGQVQDEHALPAYRWFLNVNTPEDVERADRLRVS
jgi:molybdopterin-guanine dinucleotide biosynthesis protein A